MLRSVSSEGGGSSLRSLLEAHNSEGHTALHLACRRGHEDIVGAILEYKEADVDILDKEGDPPIIFALKAGSPGCVGALLCRSANVNMKLREGPSPSIAHICSLHGHPECMLVGLNFSESNFSFCAIYLFSACFLLNSGVIVGWG